MTRVWDKYLNERDRKVYKQAGYGKRGGFGTRPALLVIDMQYNFCGDEPGESIFEGLKKYRTHCGELGWAAVPHIEQVVKVFRDQSLPIFYTVSERRPDLLDSGVQVSKSHRGEEKTVLAGTKATQTVEPIAPRLQDFLISNRKPSAFFGAPLMSQLNFLDVDTLIIVGCTTSGCIRATALEAFSYNFKVVIPEECSFDRFEFAHAASLFDLNCKYADVISVGEVVAHLSKPGELSKAN